MFKCMTNFDNSDCWHPDVYPEDICTDVPALMANTCSNNLHQHRGCLETKSNLQ